MQDDFWKALIKGLTPQSKFEVELWWKIPIVIFAILLLVSALL